jgi:Cu(I)/Ag(I) efflux system membrane protein CusA/SilA
MTETVVHLKPPDQWRRGMTVARLRAEMDRAVQFPGVSNIWTMPIINRIDMLSTGIRSEVGVKVYGARLETLEGLARQIADVLRTVPGARSVYPEQVTSGQYLNLKVDREAAARYGIGPGAIQDVIETAVGETVLNTTIEGRQRFPVRVRYAPQFRSDQQSLGDVLVTTPGGAQIPLRNVTHIESSRGPAMISSENGLLVATVLLNVQGRDVGGFVHEARAAVARSVTLPVGYYLGWSGRFENQEHARQRLTLVVPLALVVIFVLLYFTYHSAGEAAHVLLAVPFALSGGVYLLWLLGYNFSVAVWVGFIALFGTAVQTAVVMVIYLEEAVDRRRAEAGAAFSRADLKAAVMDGALLRLRPKLMTVSTVVAGLLPIMWSTRTGAEVMKPLATPVLGGMVSSLLHVLIVTPVIFYWLRARELPAEAAMAVATPASRSTRRRFAIATTAAVVVVSLAAVGWWRWQGVPDQTSDLKTIRTATSGDVRVDLLSATGTLRQGRTDFVVEFRSAKTGRLINAGTVRVEANMSMPGMPMSGGIETSATSTTGRYRATGQFGMLGVWKMAVQWDGPAGRGSVAFEGNVQ